jgi:hypothetical protein
MGLHFLRSRCGRITALAVFDSVGYTLRSRVAGCRVGRYWEGIMVHRPRTKLKLARKANRCPKCGKLVGMAFRCKTCHKKLR